ncbi:hypothetical protein ACFLTS_06275 [Chloroflexota bacterium]
MIGKYLGQARTPFLIFAVAFAIYLVSNITPLDWYKHYVYQSQAFLEGRADLQGVPEYYQDLVYYKDKVYLASPPAPALVLLPFVAIWGEGADEVRVSMFLGAVNVALVWLLLRRLGVSRSIQWLLTILFGFGTVHWEVAIHGTTWFFAEIVAVFFLLLALLEHFGRRRSFLTGLFLGLAALSRLPILPGSIFFIVALSLGGGFPRQPIKLLAGLALPLVFLAFFNFVRFGHPLETGYLSHSYASYFNDVIARHGFFSVFHIPSHLYTLLFRPPEYIDYFPFFRPSPAGMSILLTTPAVFYLLRTKFSEILNLLSAVSIVVILIPTILWFSTGWVQFGYRYSLDFVPFLLILISSGMGPRINKLKITLVVLSVAVNLWGVCWSVVQGW